MRWDPLPSARDLAPTAFKDWDVLRSEAATAVDAAMLSLIQDRIEVILGGATSSDAPANETERACTEAIEQFIIDVAELTDSQRDAVFARWARAATRSSRCCTSATSTSASVPR